jgi:hypothetical protein
VAWPASTQYVAERQEIPSKPSSARLGCAMTRGAAHAAPFQVSVKLTGFPAAFVAEPSATQSLAVRQETAEKAASE